MTVLQTAQDFTSSARVLLQDIPSSGSTPPSRYPDADFIEAINIGLMEFRRIRPDLFIPYLRVALPLVSVMADPIQIEDQFRPALLWYVCGHIQLRDDETTQDQRATIFLNKATAQLTKVES